MKNAILAIAVVALVSSSISSCKKGENDPFLSLKSRKGRITGEWELISGERTETSTFGSPTITYETTFADGNRTDVTTSGNTSSTDVYEYTHVFTLERDGSYTITATEKQISSNGTSLDPAQQSSLTTTTTGSWMFLKKNKESDVKNKEAIALTTLTSSTTENNGNGTSNSSSSTTSGFIGVEVIAIDRLTNKEMVFLIDESSRTETYSIVTEGSITFEKQ